MKPMTFDNTYIHLPERFYAREQPTPVQSPALIRANTTLAEQLGINVPWLSSPAAVEVFAGNRLAEGSEPIATVYAGHQFGSWNPQLGDGRAILLGEVVDPEGRRFDIQLKGAGQTPYSRMGDGRSPLGPVLREYIISEAMAALGVPTTRSLAAVSTGEYVFRNAALPGAVLTRVARSHIRVGHFQFFSAREDNEAVRLLADHVIRRDFPEARQADNPYVCLLEAVVSRQASLIALWQLVGFIHGVMNTDNMLLCGETIDYGPCAFMDSFDPNTCYSSIDHGKRYAYRNQPMIAQWNLTWFAQALLPLIDSNEKRAIDIAQGVINGFTGQFMDAYSRGLHRKFGLNEISDESRLFVQAFIDKMTSEQPDFTLSFRHLADLAVGESDSGHPVDFQLPDSFATLLARWRELRSREKEPVNMGDINPAYIPRNHLVEEAISTAEKDGDFTPFNQLVDVLARPFDYHPGNRKYSLPPQPHEVVKHTFCGT